MWSFAFFFGLVQWSILCLAVPHSFSDYLQRRQDAISSDLPCLNVMSAAAQGVYIFAASEVFECISKVPFHAAVASRFIDYYNDTLQFQSTLAFLKSPPDGYQQPPVDVEQELKEIRANISSGAYKSQYAFEAQVQLLISRIHDNHVTLDAGILAAFRFASPYTIVSISSDGLEEPKVYLKEDLLSASEEGYTPSPVVKINNIDAIDYLTSLVAPNSDGYLEPHADWNSVVTSPAQDIQGYLSVFQRLPLYPGDELSFTFENETSLDTIWLAMYAETALTGPLTTPGDFYNYFVLGLVPAGFDPDNSTSPPWWPAEYDVPVEDNEDAPAAEPGFNCSSSTELIVNWCSATNGQVRAYPSDPVVVQNDFSIAGAGAMSGYIFDDVSTGILSIPSFYQDGLSVKYFFNAIDEFIGNATVRDTKRVVIDLQRNSGGLVLLAMTTFQQFFPTLPPYTGSRIRSHRFADILGTAYTEWWQSLDPDSFESQDSAASEWVAVNRINAATGRNFATWSEYFGPVQDRSDGFSQKQLYNLSDRVFDYDMFGWTYQPWVNSSYDEDQPSWAPDEIVLLTDGLCSSACALFVELMTEVAGVRTITVGGRPNRGPMQTASGNRGAVVYTSNRLDFDIDNLKDLVNNTAAFDRLPSRDDTGMFTNYASINIRDQMRPYDLTPLQFRYEASDCRLYFTTRNAFNMTQLWRDAAAATWDNTTLCVPDSTNYSKRTQKERKIPPKPSGDVPLPFEVTGGQLEDPLDLSLNTSVGLVDARRPPNFNKYDRCTDNNGCSAGLVCASKATSCSKVGDGVTLKLCLEGCNNLQGPNSGCKPLNSRLAQSVSQQPVNKREAKPQRIPVTPKPAPASGAKPPSSLPQGFKLPPKTSSKSIGGGVYNGYIEPGIIKTSQYFRNTGCAV
ncbi:hypothetical protein HBI17_183340 [Parastagonospora nodorum]|nr:hypothetical protein HBH74_230020 [Parastagonospora nodorum]KAH4914898.1 hypothetical protein HBH73_243210 [Parastagonospora nodorum]KAH5345759.1 hypothetical protein HBI48_198030 [Parastagonospora nodorum]KAH5738568.1 hypothetical protein HBI17_183340 [Parastagonospora nodorum]